MEPGARCTSHQVACGDGQASKYLDERGTRVLEALDEVAAARDTTVAAVPLAWVKAQPGVAAPIASARNREQLAQILPAGELDLTADELRDLAEASAQSASSSA